MHQNNIVPSAKSPPTQSTLPENTKHHDGGKYSCMLMCALENRLGMELAINKVLMSEI